ncbi:uncharacterized protein LOC117487162 [Trematomus bernacchii]|uniref:uncharacterized protein LOC117487162 n=1 Tax=Trematomus bernacchii TaxID=40690 RepID=UPI00146CE0E2|nr:uncharacterized protein LOC117487162 [Trematomus bernacchii]
MPGGSTKKTCPFCQNILFCAQKICAHCLKEQPKKLRLEKKLKRFDEKREDWVSGRKKNHNIASIKDEAIVLLEKLHAIGFKPVLLLGKETRKKEVKCEILTPRCTLTAYAQDYLDKTGTFYEFLCEGWTQDSTGQGVAEDPEEETVTLNLTPCDPSEPENNWQEAGTSETSTVQVEVLKTPPVKQCTTKEVGQEAGTSESQVPETSTVQVEVLKTPPVKQCTIIEVGQEEQPQRDDLRQATTTEGPAVRTGSVRDTVLGPRRKKKKSDCSYHTRLETFPIRSVIRERMRKGKAEMLVEWEPCPVCGKEWAHSWQPKNSPG